MSLVVTKDQEILAGTVARWGARRGLRAAAAGVVFLPSVPGVQDALVADDEQGEQHEGCRAHQAAPVAGDVVAGGVLGGHGSCGLPAA